MHSKNLIWIFFVWFNLVIGLKVNGQYIELVDDTFPGTCVSEPCSAQPIKFATFNNRLYFVSSFYLSSQSGVLWSYDGINPPEIVQGSPNSYITEIAVFDSILLIVAKNDNDFGLWRITENSPIELVGLLNTTSIGNQMLTAFQNKIYFRLSSSLSSNLWAYDPSLSSNQIYNVVSSTAVDYPIDFVEFQDTLYFTSNTKLFSFDGTNSPVERQELYPTIGFSATPIKVFNNNLLCSGSLTGNVSKLYAYDGSNPLVLVSDINPVGWSIVYNGKFYISADNGVNGRELMVYDGVNPPSLVIDIAPGPQSSEINHLVIFQNKLFFTANDQIHGDELWVYDGVNPPHLFEDIYIGSYSSFLKGYSIFNNDLYFGAADINFGHELRVLRQDASILENKQYSLNVYPNPSNEYFFIDGLEKITGNKSVIIYNVDGTEIDRILNVNKDTPISIATSGIYFISIFSNNNNLYTVKAIRN